ncbi:MAG TPA: acetoacetate--CoA ligase [Acidimicrobiales bacterium]|nr:acetoacetate--CoA ligase [Acidimicrobiales bacterium]
MARGGVEETVEEGTVLWQPSPERVRRARMTAFMLWLAEQRGLVFTGYPELWQWSVDHLPEFWSAVVDYFDLPCGGDRSTVLRGPGGAEGASWFPGLELNYVEQVLRHPGEAPALVAVFEDGRRRSLTYGELLSQAGAAAAGLRRLGVGTGDRVAAVLGNGVEAVVGFLATASLGAVWSSCAPEFGAASMADRFGQIAPKVLICAEGYRYGGRHYDLVGKQAELEAALPGLRATVAVPADADAGAGSGGRAPQARSSAGQLDWSDLLSEPAELEPQRVAFGHPLWILYSSGTTGLPKPIVHGHGGIVVEHLKALALHSDLGPGSRFFWFTTTGWMMWNFLVGGLLVGAVVVCYDGDPMWPDPGRLWRLAAEEQIDYFGTSAPYLERCRRLGLSPKTQYAPALASIGSTGAPLSPEGFAWAAEEAGHDVQVASVSGGTDICSAFLASCPLLPVRAGELQCRALGAAVCAFDPEGHPVVGKVGELVVTAPMPSMPVGLWGDEDGSRLHDSYFAHFPGMWRHGDWVKITAEGGAVVYGRSDATLNRGGVRMGTAEFYRVVESLPEVADALVVDTTELGRQGELVLLVVPADQPAGGATGGLDPALEEQIRSVLRRQLSPRHVPDRIVAVSRLPRTLNGKKVEVPVRRILLGASPDEAVSVDALSDPGALDDVLGALEQAGLRRSGAAPPPT